MLIKHSLLCTFSYRKSNTIQLFNELGANCREAFTNLLGLYIMNLQLKTSELTNHSAQKARNPRAV